MNTANINQNAKCDAASSLVLVVDIQQQLGGAMPGKVLNRVVNNATLLTRSAGLLDVPVIKTEQYPRGLGPTVPEITQALPDSTMSFEKTAFSCAGADGLLAAIDDAGRNQIVITGMEAHVCVLQSALDFAARGATVYVVEDAICSRRLENYQNALIRLRQANVNVVTAESVVFEWLVDARHEHFKSIQNLLP